MIYLKNILIAAFLFLSILGCKKENPQEYKSKKLENSLLPNGLPNITGLFNAYKYQEDFSGYVPLEIIDIKYYEENNMIIATKLLGDKAVLSGMETFRAYYTNTFFEVTFNVWDGQTQRLVNDGSDMIVHDENSFTIYSAGATTMKFLRRVSK